MDNEIILDEKNADLLVIYQIEIDFLFLHLIKIFVLLQNILYFIPNLFIILHISIFLICYNILMLVILLKILTFN